MITKVAVAARHKNPAAKRRSTPLIAAFRGGTKSETLITSSAEAAAKPKAKRNPLGLIAFELSNNRAREGAPEVAAIFGECFMRPLTVRC